MTGRQVVGVYMLVGVALLLLLALPRTSLYSRLLLTRWYVRRREGFGQPGRRDFLRYAFYSLLGGVALAAITFFGIGTAMTHARPLGRSEAWLSGLLFGGTILSGMCVLGSVVLVVKAVSWKPLPPMAFRLYRGRDVVGETQLERESLAEGIVGGGLRPFPAYAELAPAVKDLSDAIVQSADVGHTRRLVEAFSQDNEMRIVHGSGRALEAHSVAVIDLARLKLGRGLWAEVSLRDVNAWHAPEETDETPRGTEGTAGSPYSG